MAHPEFHHIPLKPETPSVTIDKLARIAAPELGGMFKDGVQILGHEDNNVMFPDLKAALSDSRSTTVMLENLNGDPVGFSWAVDDELFRGVTPEEKTAYLYLSVIDPEYRGNHEVGPLVTSLMRELKNKGYKRLRRDVVIEPEKHEGYASKVLKHFLHDHQGSLIHEHDWEGYPGLGPQKSLEIDINKYLEEVDNQP